MKRSGGVILFLVALLTAPALAAAAIDEIVIPIDTIVRGPEGGLTELAVVVVAPEFVGATCAVSARAENNASVHPNNDIIVSSGSNSVVLLDVEGVDGGITTAAGDLVLGDTIVLTLRMGADLVFSGGLTVTVDCQATSTTTTTVLGTTTTKVAQTTTTTVIGTTTTLATTTTATSPVTTTAATAPTTTLANPTTSQVESESTTTTGPEGSSTTTDVAVLGARIEASQQLPATGIPAAAVTAAAVTLVATGFLMKRMATERLSQRRAR